MADFDLDRYSEADLFTIFERLFPNGFAGPDVLQELAPTGWQSSPLAAVFHPTAAQLFEEAMQMHRSLSSLRKPDDERPLPPEPTLEQIAEEHRDSPYDVAQETRELVGQCLWDVFSDGHEVFDSDGRLLDLGSYRTSGGFIADALNAQIDCEKYDYLSFYLGTIWVAGRADLGPVYAMIFRRFLACGLDWVYHFPRLGLVDFRPLKEAIDQKNEPDWAGYDPAEALAKEAEEREREKSLTEMRETLDEAYRESVELAADGPPPAIVRAYESVFRRLPRGWPPVV
jgi:hypothetical protein